MNEKIVIGYVRVSTEEQVKGYSLSAQSIEIENYAMYNYKDCDFELYADEGKSGKNKNRQGLKDVLNRIENSNKVKAVIVKSYDRLSRNVEDTIYLQNFFKQNDVKLITMYGEYDVNTARGKKRILEDAVDSQYEIDRLSERVITAQKEMIRQGKYAWGGKVPLGYKKDKECKLTVDKKEAEMIKDLFKQYAYEAKTEREIMEVAKKKYNLTLSKSNVGRFLVKDLYWGYIECDGVCYDVVEPILTQGDKEQLKERVRRNKFSKHDYKYRNKVYINGKLSKHQTKEKNGNEYKYYYIRGYKYIEEREITKYLIQSKFNIYGTGKEKLEDKGMQLLKSFLFGDICKADFQDKINEYKRIIKRCEQSLNRIDITVSETGNIDYSCS